jgi:hypothetical protein
MNNTVHKNTALAVCEFCGFLWIAMLTAGTVYLVGWQGWSGWTFVGMFALMTSWTCRFCPGHALYNKSKDEGE